MPKLKLLYESMDDVPEAFRELFSEKDGKAVLTEVEGMKTQDDVTRIQTSLNNERKDHRRVVADLTEKLTKYEGLGTYDEISTKLDSIPELEAKATGKIDEAKIRELVDVRVKREKEPLERENAKLKTDLKERDDAILGFKTEKTQRTIHDAVRSVALESKVVTTALDDVLDLATRVMVVDEDGKVFTKDGVGVTPNIDPKVWLQEMQEKRPHWWPPSNGGGSLGGGQGGGFGNNPWARNSWSKTEQGKIYNKDAKRAEQMARAAGVDVFAAEPAGAGK